MATREGKRDLDQLYSYACAQRDAITADLRVLHFHQDTLHALLHWRALAVEFKAGAEAAEQAFQMIKEAEKTPEAHIQVVEQLELFPQEPMHETFHRV